MTTSGIIDDVYVIFGTAGTCDSLTTSLWAIIEPLRFTGILIPPEVDVTFGRIIASVVGVYGMFSSGDDGRVHRSSGRNGITIATTTTPRGRATPRSSARRSTSTTATGATAATGTTG